MEFLKQLDDVLDFIDDGDRPAMAILSINAEFKDILEIHRNLILDKLQKDGYIEKTEGAFPNYWITYEGLMFLGNGGYKEEHRLKQITSKRATMVDYGIILAGAGAVLSVLYLFGSAILNCHCF